MDKRSFISLCVAGLAKPDEIDDYVERWHAGQAGKGQELSEYLGMSQQEYSDWVLNSGALLQIISAHNT
ncbi:hypothetical protein GCM10027321_19060 [Massilia terrae]|uniref:Uncharacterized protein n=1 Tax=Massilia terrae TaxID=1811224 RepID=A0ABT2CWM5_9BURK|nr:hypothetical protein [Massilia terrae]MCS0658367.1 hypothetical protein [Massilia terrae]